MNHKRKGKIVVLHLAARYPFAGVIWQLLHHLIGFRQLGLDVYYIEDHRAYVYDPTIESTNTDPSRNLKVLGDVLERYGFGDRWAFFDSVKDQYVGMPRERCMELLRDADAVINLCGATEPREEHERSRCLVYLETDPGVVQLELARKIPTAVAFAKAHKLLFTYCYNIGAPDCLLPTAGFNWHPTRPVVSLEEWHPGVGPAEPAKFTTVGTWQNNGNDMEIAGETYYWSKHLNFRKVLEVAARANQQIEIATNLGSGPDYDRAIAGGFTISPVIPMSLDIDTYREYVSRSRGEFTVAKDIYVRPRTGWFSDRTVCYLAAGRPVVTQRTGFEKFIPTGAGLLGFDTPDEAVDAIEQINADYPRHARVAREIAAEYFDPAKLLDEIAVAAGI
ncbi:MAG TPA: glycosyltransferase [Candidatus Limnocylindrales bacterium]|nr:glycosyltransferase [Candidatus Limnocylindrales bacterium]